MIVQSISTVLDMVNHQNRTTFYKTVEDPVTHKKVIEVIEYIYTKEGNMTASEAATKGLTIDIQT